MPTTTSTTADGGAPEGAATDTDDQSTSDAALGTGEAPPETGTPDSGDDGSDNPPDQDGDSDSDPLAAALAEVERYKAIARRHENNAKAARAQSQENAEAARQLEELRRQQMSDAERAIEDARASGRAEALSAVGSQLVTAEFRVASAGRIDADRLDTLLGVVDLSKFLNPDASVNAEAVAEVVEGIAPRPTGGVNLAGLNGNPAPPPAAPPPAAPARTDLGQGAGRNGNPPGLNEDDPLLNGLKQALNIQ